MRAKTSFSGVTYAICAAVLFGASTPFAKRLLPQANPCLLAGLLYLGSGLELALCRILSSGVGNGGAKEAPIY